MICSESKELPFAYHLIRLPNIQSGNLFIALPELL